MEPPIRFIIYEKRLFVRRVISSFLQGEGNFDVVLDTQNMVVALNRVKIPSALEIL